MKRVTSLILIICLVFMVTTPAFAKKGGGFKSGGFSKPKVTTNPTTKSSPSKNTDSDSTKTDSNTSSGDKIPYTNLPSSKNSTTTGTNGAAAAASTTGRSNLSGFAPSFSPFSGNFWFWMFLMNSFGHSQPAVAQTEGTGTAAETKTGEAAENQSGIYTPTMGDYWAADPIASTVSTLILVMVIALPIMLFFRWKKRRSAYR